VAEIAPLEMPTLIQPSAEAISTATGLAVDDLLASLGGERLYAICLQTDDGGMSIGLCANTEQGYSEKRAEAEEAGDLDASYDAYLRWDSAEWRHEMIGTERFRQVEKDLWDALDDPPGGFDAYFDRLIEAMTLALIDVKKAQGERFADVTAFVTVTDSDEAEEIENRSAVRINSTEIAAAFRARHDSVDPAPEA
jgi:hypothetical protein